ncbi:acyl-CoA dehydratase activase [Slackia exigua]|uniref:acyl-CoA dehydratase activase n=1 Tax=Slackia exigua TaxID=84109 RepID=UPI0028D482BB|nr:acyl-CoA dehydratase activase [Slackia exigua]
MYYLGCDLGSTTGKVVILKQENGQVEWVADAVEPSGFSPMETSNVTMARALERGGLSRTDIASTCATGYGRESVTWADINMSEISCHGRGAHFLCNDCRTIIDVGGQDVKVISITEKGKVVDFAMNDKCAAGTGRFFEAMARTLRVSVEELGRLALKGTEPVSISSTCSVFAESEVITAINKGADRANIAAGIHESIARRLVGMVNRVGLAKEVVLTGGCAKNPGLQQALTELLGVSVITPPCDPQLNGALGAALFACSNENSAPSIEGRLADAAPLCEGCRL